MRVELAHRYDVPVDRGFAFITNTANWPTFWPGFVRLEPGSEWSAAGDTARLVTYTSTQPGLPDAYHERHFEPDRDGFVYRLVVEYEPRGGVGGVFDRLLLARGIRRAFESTFVALDREFAGAAPGG